MPITIGPGQLISPEASANYFQMIAAARRAEADRKQREQQMFMQAIAQGVSNFTTPLRDAARDRRIEDREDKRWERQLEAQREARNQSAATQMDMTPTEYAEFSKTNTMPTTFAARAQAAQRQRVQQLVQVEQIKRQQEAKAKATEEALYRLEDDFQNGRLPQPLHVQYASAIAERAAIYDDPRHKEGKDDPEQFQARAEANQNKIVAIAMQVKPPETDAQKFGKAIIVPKNDPNLKPLIDAGVLDPNAAYYTRWRDGHPYYELVPGVMTAQEKAKHQLDQDKLNFEIRQFEAEQSGKGKDAIKGTGEKFDLAMKYLRAKKGSGEFATFTDEEIQDAMLAVERGPVEHAIKVTEDNAKRRAGSRRPQVEAVIQASHQAQQKDPTMTPQKILLAQMQALIAENPGKSPQVRALLQEYRDMLALFEEEGAE